MYLRSTCIAWIARDPSDLLRHEREGFRGVRYQDLPHFVYEQKVARNGQKQPMWFPPPPPRLTYFRARLSIPAICEVHSPASLVKVPKDPVSSSRIAIMNWYKDIEASMAMTLLMKLPIACCLMARGAKSPINLPKPFIPIFLMFHTGKKEQVPSSEEEEEKGKNERGRSKGKKTRLETRRNSYTWKT